MRVLLIFLVLGLPAAAQPTGKVERVKVHGKSLEGNLEGDSPDREVLVYLPASYAAQSARRYPVLYLLHGFTDDPDHWWGFRRHFINLPTILDKVASSLIVVMPNAYTAYLGSMYSNSAVTGNWEDFVANDLVAYIDAHYRTVSAAAGRGLAGHSMGGYGALRIGMHHPEVYSSLYVMSPCCIEPWDTSRASADWVRAESVHSAAELAKADFGVQATVAEAAAWSPNPKTPPLFFDLPAKDGRVRPEIVAKWNGNSPLVMIDQYIANLRQFRAIAFDVGLQDHLLPGAKDLDDVLNRYALPHTFETYEGDHVSRIAARVESKVIPYFTVHLHP